jgi:hypothetical protein
MYDPVIDDGHLVRSEVDELLLVAHADTVEDLIAKLHVYLSA